MSNCPWGNLAPHRHHSILVRIFFPSVTCFRDTLYVTCLYSAPKGCMRIYVPYDEFSRNCLRRIPLLKGRFNLNSNKEGEIHLPLKFGENEELKIAAAEI